MHPLDESSHPIRLLQSVICTEKNFYYICANWRPRWSQLALTGGMGAYSANIQPQLKADTLFGELSDKFIKHSMECFPELPLRSDPLTGGYHAESKSVDGYMIRQGIQYTLMDMTHSLFSSKRDEAFFYETPPTGYCLLAFPHVGYYVSVEMAGRVFVNPVTSPFFLGSERHQSVKESLVLSPLGTRRNLHEILRASSMRKCDELKERSMFTSEPVPEMGQLVFYKLIRWDAFPQKPDYFARLYQVYTKYSSLVLPPSLLKAQLLFGECQVAVRMPFLCGVRSPTEDDWASETNRQLHDDVATAIHFLASKGLLYTDLRLPNVLFQGLGQRGFLVDYDDIEPVTPLLDYASFKTQLDEYVPEGTRKLDMWDKVLPLINSKYDHTDPVADQEN